MVKQSNMPLFNGFGTQTSGLFASPYYLMIFGTQMSGPVHCRGLHWSCQHILHATSIPSPATSISQCEKLGGGLVWQNWGIEQTSTMKNYAKHANNLNIKKEEILTIKNIFYHIVMAITLVGHLKFVIVNIHKI